MTLKWLWKAFCNRGISRAGVIAAIPDTWHLWKTGLDLPDLNLSCYFICFCSFTLPSGPVSQVLKSCFWPGLLWLVETIPPCSLADGSFLTASFQMASCTTGNSLNRNWEDGFSGKPWFNSVMVSFLFSWNEQKHVHATTQKDTLKNTLGAVKTHRWAASAQEVDWGEPVGRIFLRGCS